MRRGAEGQTRTVDTGIFSAVLYHLSYLGAGFHYRIRRSHCQGEPRRRRTIAKSGKGVYKKREVRFGGC